MLKTESNSFRTPHLFLMCVYFQPLKSGHLTNQDTFFFLKGVWIRQDTLYMLTARVFAPKLLASGASLPSGTAGTNFRDIYYVSDDAFWPQLPPHYAQT